MNHAERLHRNSHLLVPLAITEAIQLYKPELNKDKAKIMSPITPETDMIKEPNDPYQKTKTAKMEERSKYGNLKKKCDSHLVLDFA